MWLPHASWWQILKNCPIQLAETAKKATAMCGCPSWHWPPALHRPATKSSRSAPSMGARRSTSRSTRRLALPSRRSICRPISHPHLRSRRPSSDTSTSQRPARGCATAAACGESMPIRSCSCAATPRPSIGRRILAERAFVDCSHAYDYARTASESAMRLVKTGGIVLWHDYGVWPSVTQALDELEAERPWPGQYPRQQPGVLARRTTPISGGPHRLDRIPKTHYISPRSKRPLLRNRPI